MYSHYSLYVMSALRTCTFFICVHADVCILELAAQSQSNFLISQLFHYEKYLINSVFPVQIQRPVLENQAFVW